MKNTITLFKNVLIIFFLFSFCDLTGQNIIQNGNFSTPNSYWTKIGNFQFDSRFTNYHSASSYAYLADFTGLPADNISGQLYQDFFVPAGTGSLSITFWYRITTAEPPSQGNDTLRVSIIDPSNPSTEYLIDRFTNRDANSTYSISGGELQSIQTGKNWRIKFSAGTNATLPTVFRIDDVEVIANPSTNMNCINWSGGIHPDPLVDTAMNTLCSKGIISNSQNAFAVNSAIQRIEVARFLGKALLGNVSVDFMDYFPSLFPEVDKLNLEDKRYVKLMLYLEYKSKIAPLSGSDDISPFSREYFYTSIFSGINKSDAIKALLETWDLAPVMFNYNPGSNATSPLVCDMKVSHKNLGWVERAIPLGLLNNIISTPCGSNSINFGPDSNVTYGQFYVMLARLLNNNKPSIGYDDFFTPNLFYLNNLNTNVSLEKGVFNEYSGNDFNIPSGGLGLSFNYSYHSNLTEIPVLTNDIDNENFYLKAKLQPLGGGWTHSYNIFIRTLDIAGAPPERMLIYWPDGTIHSYLVPQGKYETKGLTDKLTIDSNTALGYPGKVTIRKGRIVYTFKNIDPASYNVLSIINISDAHGNSLLFDYISGVAQSGFEPKLLSKVTDSYGSRALNFNYWPGTNYLKSVTDPIGRIMQFYPNRFTHDLDSSADAKGQVTKYTYKLELGTLAYRTHLVTSVIRPKGNTINNVYFSRKLMQTHASNYIIKVNAVPDYRTAWSKQTSSVTQIQNNQELTNTYIFNGVGSIVDNISIGNKTQTQYDSENRPVLQRDLNRGYIKKTSYDGNGYLNKVVVIDSFYNDSIKYSYINNQYGEPTSLFDYNDESYPLIETKIYRDNEGNPTEVVRWEGIGFQVRHQYQYLNGLPAIYISPNGFQTEFQRDSYGNIIKVIQFPELFNQLSISESYSYDAVSRLISYTDFNGDSKSFEYDQNDNIRSSTVDPLELALKTENTVDANDNVILIKSPNGHNTELSYDFLTDDFIEENDGTNKKRWKYNSDGSLDSFITKNNVSFKFEYFSRESFPNDSTLWGMLRSDNFTYYNYWPQTKAILNITNNNGKANGFNYFGFSSRGKWDKADRVYTNGFFSGNEDFVSYGYDRYGRPTMVAYPSYGGKDYNYGYLYDQMTKNVEQVFDRNTQFLYAKYVYKKDGKVLQEMYGNGDTIFHHYDAFDREDSLWAKNKKNQLLYTISAKLDKNGKHIEENTKVFYQGQEITTLPSIISGQTVNYNFEPRNRIISGNNRTYTSNGAGEITSITNPNFQLSWNQYGQITNFNIDGVNTPVEYDALGNRKKLGNTYFVVDQQNTGNSIMEAEQNTTPISVYIYGRGLVARVDPKSDSIFYYHYDFRGSVIAITNTNGDLVKAYQYEPYGTVYNSVGSISWKNPFQYLGKHGVQTDFPDIYYSKARYYQPSTGRFISEDLVWATNLFIYGNDDPINNIDPNGNIIETILDGASIGYSTYEFWRKPSWQNAGMLGWDIGATFIPFLPGSYIKRGLDGGQEAIKLYKAEKTGNVTLKFTQSTLKLGREVHDNYKLSLHAPELGLFKEYRVFKGIRPDFVDFNTRTIYELKPFNPRGIKSGKIQLLKYKKRFELETGEVWHTILEFY